MELKRVVVTGMGAVTPLGNNLETYWDNLAKGVSGASRITKFDPENFKTQFACELKGFNVNDHIHRKEAKKMDPFVHYAMVCADEAVKMSGLDQEGIDKDRIGVIWGSGIGGLFTFQEEVMNYAQSGGNPRFNPYFIPKMIIDLSSGHISMKYGFHGPNFSVVSACATSTNAIADAFNYIRLGKANAFVTGGSEAAVTESGIGGFNACKALSERNDAAETASRPYDATRDGFVLGEGGGALVLEELEHAKARGAKIYGEVLGAGMSGDAYHLTAPHPEGLGVKLVVKEVLSDANLKPEHIDYINTHGTSTPAGDMAELKAIQEVLGSAVYDLNISSTKSMTGHLLGAAGAIEALACLLAINKGIVPPTINVNEPDENLDPKLKMTFNEAEKREVRYAMSNTFGFGGHNSSLIFGRYED